jgi:hypothetical protein
MSKWLELARTMVYIPEDRDNSVNSRNRWSDRGGCRRFVANVSIDTAVGLNEHKAPPAAERDTAAFLIGASPVQRREWWRRGPYLSDRDRDDAA